MKEQRSVFESFSRIAPPFAKMKIIYKRNDFKSILSLIITVDNHA